MSNLVKVKQITSGTNGQILMTSGGKTVWVDFNDTYVSGMTFNDTTHELTLDLTSGGSYTESLSALTNSDKYITGGTYNSSTGIVTFKNNSGDTFGITGFSSGDTSPYEYDSNIGIIPVLGGNDITISSSYSTIAGGSGNTINTVFSFIGGGDNNTIGNTYSAIVGGSSNECGDSYSFIGGGIGNFIDVDYSTIAGGDSNESYSQYTFIGGGSGNIVNGTYSTIAGGLSNSTSGSYGFIGGGDSNSVLDMYNVIGGGDSNSIDATYSFIGGGSNHTIEDTYNSIVGGISNFISGNYSSVLGGNNNSVNGNHSSIINGSGNTINANNSVIISINDTTVTNDNTLFLDYLNINTLGTTTGVETLGRDANGLVVVMTANTVDDTLYDIQIVSSDRDMVVADKNRYIYNDATITLTFQDGSVWDVPVGSSGIFKRVEDDGSFTIVAGSGVQINGESSVTYEIDGGSDKDYLGVTWIKVDDDSYHLIGSITKI